MGTKVKTEFQKWIGNIKHENYAPIRDAIIKECGVSRATFASWSRGATSPDLDKRVTIAVIAYNYNEEIPFGNMYIDHDEEGNPQVIVR